MIDPPSYIFPATRNEMSIIFAPALFTLGKKAWCLFNDHSSIMGEELNCHNVLTPFFPNGWSSL